MWSNEEKVRFRQRKAWKDFTQKLWDDLPVKKCQLLGTKLLRKRAQFHHLDPENYDVLDPGKFKILSPAAHDFVEHVAKVIRGIHSDVPNLEKLIDWIGDFLPKIEGGIQKYYDDIKRNLTKH